MVVWGIYEGSLSRGVVYVERNLMRSQVSTSSPHEKHSPPLVRKGPPPTSRIVTILRMFSPRGPAPNLTCPEPSRMGISQGPAGAGWTISTRYRRSALSMALKSRECHGRLPDATPMTRGRPSSTPSRQSSAITAQRAPYPPLHRAGDIPLSPPKHIFSPEFEHHLNFRP